MQKGNKKKQLRKPQHQRRPGLEKKLSPPPVFDYPERPGTNKLIGKKALITGADSGIGKAVAVLFAKEGADVAIAYLNEQAAPPPTNPNPVIPVTSAITKNKIALRIIFYILIFSGIK